MDIELRWQDEGKLHLTELNVLDEMVGQHAYIGKILEYDSLKTKDTMYIADYVTYKGDAKQSEITSKGSRKCVTLERAKQWIEDNIGLQFDKDHTYENKDYSYELNQERKAYEYLCYIDSPYKHSDYPCAYSKIWIDENNIEIDKDMYNLISKFADKERVKIKEELEANFGKYSRDKDDNDEQER